MDELAKWLTLGPMALRLGVLEGQLRRMCKRNEIPHKVFNGSRVFHLDDLDAIRAVCVARGYLRAEPEAVAHAG